MTKRKVDEDIEKINAELRSIRQSERVPIPRASTIRLVAIFVLMIILAFSVMFTYGRISGLQVVGNETALPVAAPEIPTVSMVDSQQQEQLYISDVIPGTDTVGEYEVIIDAQMDAVKKIKLHKVKQNKNIDIRLEELPPGQWKQHYSIDLSSINFTDGEMTVLAQGDMLFKCADWNFMTQECYGNWTKVMDLVPGREYTIQLSPVDPGFGELSLNTYYMFQTTDPQYPAYRRLLNQTVGGTQYASTALSITSTGIQCWPSQWIANNWTQRTAVNGTWTFSVYAGCTHAGADAYIFARVIKLNSTGAYNFQNTTQTVADVCDGATTARAISYSVPASSFTDLLPGERIGVSYCLNVVTGKNGKTASIYWEGGTPSNVNFPTAAYDSVSPNVTLISPANLTSTTATVINFTYNVSDANPIANCSLVINGVVNKTNTTVTRNTPQNFTTTLTPGIYSWYVNCTDNTYNTGKSPTRQITIAVQAETIPPTWSNNKTYPVSGSVYSLGQAYQFNVTWQDNINVSEIKIEHNFTGAQTNYTIATKNGNEYYYNYPALAAGTYAWKEYGKDNSSNTNSTDNWLYIVNKAASSVNLLLDGVDGNITRLQGSYVNITGYRVAGEGNISTYINGSLINRGTGPLTNITQFLTPSLYNITVFYNSTKNYTTSSETHYINVTPDISRPNVTNVVAAPAIIGLGDTVNISADVIDNVGLSSVIARVRYPNTTTINYPMSNIGGTKYAYLFTTTVYMPLGIYNVTIISTDYASNVNDTEKTYFTTQDAAPIINSYSDYPDPVAVNSTIRIQANVTDNTAVDTVWVNVNGTNIALKRNVTTFQTTRYITGSTGDCTFSLGSTADQANTSDNYRALQTATTCGWNVQDLSANSFSGFNNITVYVEHVGETGVSAGSTTLQVGNTTSNTAYGSSVLSTNAGNQNKLEESQGLAVIGEGTDSFVVTVLPSTISAFNNLQVRIVHTDGNDLRGTDRIYLVVSYNTTTDIFYADVSTHGYALGTSNYTIYANDTLGQTSNVSGSFYVDYVNAPVANIITPTDSSVFNQGADINFTGTGYDFEDGNLTGTSLVWSSDIDGTLGTGEQLLFATLSPGNHTITLTTTDSFGLTDTDAISVTIDGLECPGLEAGKFTLANITIDGNMTDWDPVLQDPDNVVVDGVIGITDLDDPQASDKDLKKFAMTWNEQYIWMYVRRSSGGKNDIGIDTYFDYDQDYLLESTDDVLVTTWQGSNRQYDTSIFDYVPANASGDPVGGDGFTEPGTIANEVGLDSNILGGSEEGIELEWRVAWADLDQQSCTPVISHISSAIGSGKNIPSQIVDNMASFDSRIVYLKFYPDSIKSGKIGTTVTHQHTLRNIGNIIDTYNLNITGTTPGFTTTLFFANGTLLTDTDGDGRIDTGSILPGYGVTIYMNVSIPLSAVSGQVDTTTITANSNISNSTNASVTDTTIVGSISVIPNNKGFATSGTTVEYQHQVYNNDIDSVINLAGISNQGYTVTIHYTNGTQITDTNTDTYPDIGLIPKGTSKQIKVRIVIPPTAPIGTIDNTTIIANSTFGESAKAYDTTTITAPISITPNITRAAGQGTTAFLIHTITYVSSTPGAVDITFNQTQAFPMTIYHSDYATPLTDTNGNGIIDTGLLGINGVTKNIVVKLGIPPTAAINTTDIIHYNASSNITPYIATAKDNVSVQKLVSYLDPSFITQSYLFKQTQTVYAQAYALTQASVSFQYIDPNATVRRTSPAIPVDVLNQADDYYYLNASDLSGLWILILYDGGTEITRINYQVNTPPVILNITDYPDPVYEGDKVNFTVNITAGETRWFLNETVVKGALLEIAGKNYSMTGPNTTTGIGQYYFDSLNTSNLTAGTYLYRVFAYDNFTFNNVSTPLSGYITIKTYNITNVSGVITDSRYNIVPSSIYVYNSTGHVVWTDDETYSFVLDRGEAYNVTVMPNTGSINEITYIGVTWPSQIINFTRLEDTLENDTDKPDEIYNWTESIAWWASPTFYFNTAKINFSYGAGTGLAFWKCTDWNFDNRSCNNNNFVVQQDLPDGPNSAVVYLSASDPGAGAGKKPKYNETLRVWDVTGLSQNGRRDNGTLVGNFYNLAAVNLTIGKSYRFEVIVTQTNPDAIGIISDPYYDNIQDDWIVDINGTDSPNVTQINGSVVINSFAPTLAAGTEPGTQVLTWDAVPPHRLVEDMNANDTVKFWFVFDIPINASNETHDGHFLGTSKGEDAEINNNLTTLIGSPPYPVNLTYPDNGNTTITNRTLTFVWEPGYDPDNQTLTYSINITSEFCSDIYDTGIVATNYTPIFELGTYDECGAYNWTVRAYDGYFYGNWSDSWNFSISPYVALIFINDTVDFGTADNDETNDTTDNNPYPFIMRSDGNVRTDVVNVSSNQSFFTSALAQDSDFQIKVDQTAELNSFNWTGSAFNWINLTTIQTIIDYFDWHDTNDTAEIDVKVHVPIDESPGVKITGLVFYGEQS